MTYKLMIVMRKEKKYKLITKIIDVFGKEFSLNDLLLSNSLSSNEKEELKQIFGGDFTCISGQDFYFENEHGKWINEREGQLHRYTMKILNSLHRDQIYSAESEILPCYTKLTETLLNKFENVINEEDGSEVDSHFEIDREELDFISNDLSNRFGKTAKVDYHFVKAFMESRQQYDEIMLQRSVERGFLE